MIYFKKKYLFIFYIIFIGALLFQASCARKGIIKKDKRFTKKITDEVKKDNEKYREKAFILTQDNVEQYNQGDERYKNMPIIGGTNIFNNILKLGAGNIKFNPLIYDNKGRRMCEPVNFSILKPKIISNKTEIKFKLSKAAEENGTIINPPKLLFRYTFTNCSSGFLISWIEINRIVGSGTYPHKDGGYEKTPRKPRHESYWIEELNDKNIFGIYNIEIEYIFHDLKIIDRFIFKGIKAIREPIDDFAHQMGVYTYFSGESQ